MENKKGIEILTLKELLNKKYGKYIIPIYQRNYAWEKTEIEQLVDDLYSASTKQDNKNYYIGSLIVYKRENGDYEVIDGQQRLTTLTILYSVLSNEGFFKNKDKFRNLGENLSFEHRLESKNSLNRILNEPNLINKRDNIEIAYEIIKSKLSSLDLKENDENLKFYDFIFNNVKILRTEVLPNTDLNHYFEIMNSRGEQLEKHEILKAHFMGMFNTKEERKLFAMIWDACSDMDRNVAMGFPAEFRKSIFFENKNEVRENFNIEDFSELLKEYKIYLNDISERSKDIDTTQKTKKDKNVNASQKTENENKLSYILSHSNNDGYKEKDDENKDVTTRSIIDFSNFLMHALKLHKEESLDNKSIELDDKKIIDNFKTSLKDLDEIKSFIINLLKVRLYFDKFIIKYTQSSDDDWSLQTLKWNNKSNKFYYVDTFSKISKQERIILLLSMFQTIYRAKNYKNWLYSILDGFFNRGWNNYNYINELEKLAKEHADKITDLDEGTNVRHFIFNYLDYLIYKKFKKGKLDEVLPILENRIGEKKLNKYFENFKFSYRRSIEHCYPQNADSLGKWKENDDKELIDTFGNLCLIEPSFNSSLSDNSISLKREKLIELLKKNNKRSASLKQVIMLMYKDDCWEAENAQKTIKDHKEKMFKLLGR